MQRENQLQGQIAQVLIRFAEIHLRVKPRAALVDLHERSVVVTLEDILPPVERDYARDKKGHDLLDESYIRMFACVRRMAEIELELILGRRIKNSILRVDPESGNAFLVFNFADGLGSL
ncbi:MAG: DUF2294 family protein [Phycisphaeraceae bacterium]|nr:DUF2294 family protein [Phycisphaeraceae bacterium]